MCTFNINARFVHMTDATVYRDQYTDGSLALVAESIDEDGYPDNETLSVNLGPAYGMVPPDDDMVYVKNYAEHEGLAEALVLSGIAVVVDRHYFGPFGLEAILVKLTDKVPVNRESAVFDRTGGAM